MNLPSASDISTILYNRPPIFSMAIPSLLYNFTIVATFTLLGCAVYQRRRARISISHIPGPKSANFLLGHLGDLHQKQAAEADFEWFAKYGSIVRFKGTLGEDRLLVSDPRAMQYIYQTSAYRFKKVKVRQEVARSIAGHGLLWADDDAHKRQRRVMLPGFGTPETKAYVPIFAHYAAQVTTKWKEIIAKSGDESAVVDISRWASRATLDAFGMAAFDYQFGSLDDSNNVLSKAYVNMFAKTFALPSSFSLFWQDMWRFVPRPILEFLRDHVPTRRTRYTHYVAKVANSVARSLIATKKDALFNGKSSRDVLSLLVRANASTDPHSRLTDEELLDEMRTLIMAGHETVSNSVGWLLHELAQHPEIQNTVRHEIRAMEQHIHSLGRAEFTPKDFDNMPWVQAVVKETLRLHPVVYHASRKASQDEVLPLSRPIITETGEVLTELVVPKGTKLITSFAGYNRNKDVFGEDVHDFNPSRWIDREDHVAPQRKLPSMGVYNNLMSFAGGVRACLGWRFAILEMTSLLVELVGNFEFSPTPESRRIRREACVIMIPTVEGEFEKGKQLPLRVRLAPCDED